MIGLFLETQKAEQPQNKRKSLNSHAKNEIPAQKTLSWNKSTDEQPDLCFQAPRCAEPWQSTRMATPHGTTAFATTRSV